MRQFIAAAFVYMLTATFSLAATYDYTDPFNFSAVLTFGDNSDGIRLTTSLEVTTLSDFPIISDEVFSYVSGPGFVFSGGQIVAGNAVYDYTGADSSSWLLTWDWDTTTGGNVRLACTLLGGCASGLAETFTSTFVYLRGNSPQFSERMNVVPLPAGGILLVTALAGLLGVRRSKKALSKV